MQQIWAAETRKGGLRHKDQSTDVLSTTNSTCSMYMGEEGEADGPEEGDGDMLNRRATPSIYTSSVIADLQG